MEQCKSKYDDPWDWENKFQAVVEEERVKKLH